MLSLAGTSVGESSLTELLLRCLLQRRVGAGVDDLDYARIPPDGRDEELFRKIGQLVSVRLYALLVLCGRLRPNCISRELASLAYLQACCNLLHPSQLVSNFSKVVDRRLQCS